MKRIKDPTARQEFCTNNLRHGCHRVEFSNRSEQEFSETEIKQLINAADRSFCDVRPKVIVDTDCELRTLAVFVRVDIQDKDVHVGVSFGRDDYVFQSSRFTLGNSSEKICEYLGIFASILWPLNERRNIHNPH